MYIMENNPGWFYHLFFACVCLHFDVKISTLCNARRFFKPVPFFFVTDVLKSDHYVIHFFHICYDLLFHFLYIDFDLRFNYCLIHPTPEWFLGFRSASFKEIKLLFQVFMKLLTPHVRMFLYAQCCNSIHIPALLFFLYFYTCINIFEFPSLLLS